MWIQIHVMIYSLTPKNMKDGLRDSCGDAFVAIGSPCESEEVARSVVSDKPNFMDNAKLVNALFTEMHK